MPQIVFKKLLKPRSGDLRQLVLPGGGDLRLRTWSGMRRYVAALTGWLVKRRTLSPAFRFHILRLEKFLANEAHHFQHAWNMLEEKERLRTHCDFLFFLEIIAEFFK